jgi:cell division protein FtsW (lipid II flippase)
LFLTGLALAILLTQRDLGTASIFIFLYAAMVYLASGKRRLLLGSLGLLVLAALVGYFFVDIIRYRLAAWIDPWTDPSGRSYQVIQSILAVANGGLYGRGPGLGSPSLVPVAHSDFIFTSIAEENGLLGSFALLVLQALVVARGFLITIRAASNFRRLLAAGITTYFGAQSVLIMGGNLRLLPLTGVTLPFVSYGGSSLLTSFIGLLILIQISNEVDEEPAELHFPQPYLNMASLIGVGLLACSLANGWWAAIRADDLLIRTDNPPARYRRPFCSAWRFARPAEPRHNHYKRPA